MVGIMLVDLINGDCVERVWPDGEGRARYIIVPGSALKKAQPPAAVPPEPIDAPIAPPPAASQPIPQQEEPTMPKDNTSIQTKIINAITAAGGTITARQLSNAFPNLDGPERRHQLGLLCKAERLVATGATAARCYHLPGVETQPAKGSAKPTAAQQQIVAAAEKADRALIDTEAQCRRERAAIAPPPTAHFGQSELRAAAAEILLHFGAEPMPRALHRLVVHAAGAPAESIAA
jgi:hypothetical protein